MVLLTVPAHLLAAIEVYNGLNPTSPTPLPVTFLDHRQIHQISQSLLSSSSGDKEKYRLPSLLRGCSVYIPPRPPKPEPTAEYKALMARLRLQAEAREYSALIGKSLADDADEEDEYTFQDLKSQLSVIANVLLSTVATSVAVWMAARGWDVPERFALAFACSIVVCVAEVVVFGGYLRRIEESKREEKARVKKEVKEVVNVWEIGGVGKAIGGVRRRK